MAKIGKRLVDDLKPEDREYFVWDDRLTGFGVRVHISGRKTFVVQYRAKGGGRGAPTRRLTLGAYGKITPDIARKAAEKALANVALGGDPVETKRERRRDTGKSFPGLLDLYTDKHLRTIRSGDEVERTLRRELLPNWNRKRVDEITRADVIEAVDVVADRGALYAANNLLAYIHKFFAWCLSRGLISINPAAGVHKPQPSVGRDRVLTKTEIRAFWEACENDSYPFGPFGQLLLLTAQRRNEVAGIQTGHIHGDNAVWTIPREHTKADRAHEVPLVEAAIELISNQPVLGEYVFSTTGRSPISGFSRFKQRLDKAMVELMRKWAAEKGEEFTGLHPWRLHDLRRTAATYMARAGVPRDHIALILNHALPGITAIYDRASRLPEKRHALETWASCLNDILRPDQSGKVVKLRKTT